MSNLLKNLLFALGITILLFVAYMVFMRGSDEPTALTASQGMTTEQASLETQALLATLRELKSYNVDGKIFDDSRFDSLIDFRVELIEEPTGRPNPFAPIE